MIESEPTTRNAQAGAKAERLNGVMPNGAAPLPPAANEEYPYLFPYREPSSYSHVVDLARQYVAPGVIIDLGAGAGTIGEPLQRAGFTYIGVERHPEALQILAERDFRNHAADLDDPDALRALFDALPDTKAFCLIDVLEHLHEPEPLLRFLSAYARAHHAPYLLISVPNVAHRDVALNLLRGQWNVTEYGLLDKTHVAYYTRQSLLALLDGCGWSLVTRNDFTLDESDQFDPDSILHTDSLIGDVLRYTTRMFNPDSATNQFIWLLKPTVPAEGAIAVVETADAVVETQPLVSVLMRTQGTRNELMTEALYAVFAQDCDDYEIVVCFHNPADTDGKLLQGVNDLIATLPVDLRRSIRVIRCTGTGRSAPLNQLFADARGEYLTILDDDDLLFPRHISTIKKGIEKYGIGPMFQSFAVQRRVDVYEPKERSPEFGFKRNTLLDPQRPTGTYPYTVQSIEPIWAKPFDPLRQQYDNAVHVSNFIVPRRLVEQTLLRFRNDFEYAEDWQFWMEASQILKVVTLPEITGVQNVRTNGTNTVNSEQLQPEWVSSHRRRFAVQAGHPIILDGRTSSLIYRRQLEIDRNNHDLRLHYAALEHEHHRQDQELLDLRREHHRQDELGQRYAALEREYRQQGEWAQSMERHLHEYERQTVWAQDLERQLAMRRGLIPRAMGLVRRVAGRIVG